MSAHQIFTLREASAYWGVGISSLRSLIVQGRLAANKDGQAYQIAKRELDAFERAHTEEVFTARLKLLNTETPYIPSALHHYHKFHDALDRFTWLLKAYYTPRDLLSHGRFRLDVLLQHYIQESVQPSSKIASALKLKQFSYMRKEQSEALEHVWYNELAFCYPPVEDPFLLTPAAVNTNSEASYERLQFPSWRITKAYYTVYHSIRALCDICGVSYRRKEHISPLKTLNATKLAPLSRVVIAFPFSLGYGAKAKGTRYVSYLSKPKPHLAYKYANHPRPPHESFDRTLEGFIGHLRRGWLSWPPSKRLSQQYMLPDLLRDFRNWVNYVDIGNMLSLYGPGYRGYLDMNLRIVVFFYVAIVELVAIAVFGPKEVIKHMKEFEQLFIHKSDALWDIGGLLPTHIRFSLFEHLGRLDDETWVPEAKPKPQIEFI